MVVGWKTILDVGLELRRRAASERDRIETVLLVESAGLQVALKREESQLRRGNLERLPQQRRADAAALKLAEHGELPYPGPFEREQPERLAGIVRDPDFATRDDVLAKKRPRIVERVAPMLGDIRIAFDVGFVPATDERIEVVLAVAPDLRGDRLEPVLLGRRIVAHDPDHLGQLRAHRKIQPLASGQLAQEPLVVGLLELARGGKVVQRRRDDASPAADRPCET